MKTLPKVVLLYLMVLIIAGCSRKKDTFLNRNWHAVTAEYNTLYNGNLALDLGKQELQRDYRDNYWDVLPVERMQVREEVMLPGNSKNPNFEVAEEKAVKAIQRHSMLLDGQEKNPQMDEAYLLLGKARYYDNRFVPALEAFNYVLHKYPLSDKITQTQIWREKTHMRLEFNALAVRNLKRILDQERIEDQEIADASAVLAQAYFNLSAKDSALVAIKEAANFTKDKEEKGRYLYIKGQLYNELGYSDSANIAFDEVIDLNRRIPRVYLVNAHIQKIRNLARTNANKPELLAYLSELEGDRENRPFLDKIYFQLAEFHYQRDSTRLAIDYYNQSLRSPSNDQYLQSLDYQTLGNIYFDAGQYETAGAYYDSTMSKLHKTSGEYRLIKKKRDNLEDVIYYEELARNKDSILYLTTLTYEEQLDYFTRYTEELKERMQSNTVSNPVGDDETVSYFDDKKTGMPAMPGVPNPGNSFYFYNASAVAHGEQEFFRKWGNIELTDNWRYGGGRGALAGTGASGEDAFSEDDPVFNPDTYISAIPKDQEEIDSLVKDRNFAWYQLGLIYKEKFRDNERAAEKLELVLQNEPEERLILPAKYHLYKIYNQLGNRTRAASHKSDILHRYPDSRYAAIIENPESTLNDEDNPNALYKDLYALYEDQKYEEVIDRAKELSIRFTGDEIVPKLELLKAMASGRLMGFEAYKENLSYVALNYPQAEEGKKAQQILEEAIPSMASTEFKADSAATSFKLVFPFEKKDNDSAAELVDQLEEVLEELGYTQLRVSLDVYDPEQVFVVVHGHRSSSRAKGFAELLSVNKNYLIKKNSFYISTPNYRIAQIHKNIETYLNTN